MMGTRSPTKRPKDLHANRQSGKPRAAERGATMVEYAVILLLIAAAAVGAVALLGPATNALFSDPALAGAL